MRFLCDFHVSCCCEKHYTFIKIRFLCFQNWTFCQTVQPKNWNQACSTSEDFMGRLLSKYKSKEDNERWSGMEKKYNRIFILEFFFFLILFFILYSETWPQILLTQCYWRYKVTRIALQHSLEHRTFQNWPLKCCVEEIPSNSAQ